MPLSIFWRILEGVNCGVWYIVKHVLATVKQLLGIKKKINASISDLAKSCELDISRHSLETTDGYVLGIYRLCLSSKDDILLGSPAVLILHGLLQDSESFLCGGKNASLASVLCHAGYDVWLGNNRGCQHSVEHSSRDINSASYWDYSLDELALYDVPAMVNYVLEQTGRSKLVVIGFSQGSAQAIAALSIQSVPSEKISLVIALAPPVVLTRLKNKRFHSLITWNPFFPSHLLGSRNIFKHFQFIKSMHQTPENFRYGCTLFFWICFGWVCNNWSKETGAKAFNHGFSPTSVKSVVHWFQMLCTQRLCKFQTYSQWARGDAVDLYDMSTIRTPIATISGSEDGFIEPFAVSDMVPTCEYSHVEPGYEHLDLIWADDAKEKIFSRVLTLLKKYSATSSTSTM